MNDRSRGAMSDRLTDIGCWWTAWDTLRCARGRLSNMAAYSLWGEFRRPVQIADMNLTAMVMDRTILGSLHE